MALSSFYVASKTDLAVDWRVLRLDWHSRGIARITSRWIDHPEAFPEDAEDAKRSLWLQIMEDLGKSDAIIIRARPRDVFKGALVELGAMLVQGKRAYVIGDGPSLQAGDRSDASFMAHPLVWRVDHVDDAVALENHRRH